MLPMVPQAGRAYGPELVPARLHTSVPTGNALGSTMRGTGVKKVRVWFTGSSGPTPNFIEPFALFGRHGPLPSKKAPHSLILGVHGRPLLQLVVLLTCQPPITRSLARPTPLKYDFPFPKGSSYTVLSTQTWLRLKSTGPHAIG